MRITALLFRRVGDSLLATPALRAIKQTHPGAELCVISEPQTARVFAFNPWIDHLSVVDSGPSVLNLTAAIRQLGKPDITLDFLSDPRSALACRLGGARQRVGFAGRGRTWAYTHPVARQDADQPVYSALHKLGIAAALGIEISDTSTEFFLCEADHAFAAAAWGDRDWTDEQSVTAFFVHSRRNHKRWPLDCFREVIRRMREDSISAPLVLATPGDESAVAELRARANLSVKQVLPVHDLGQLGGVLERCSLLVGNDGGPKHIAVALDVPTVTVFGPDSPVYWTPDSPKHVAITAEANPSNPGASLSVTDVLPSKVYEAAAAMLAQESS